MNETRDRVLYWAPRIVAILYALFLGLFALDVFGQGYGLWDTILALLIHLVPTYLVLIALLVAWRWEGVGSILLLGLGLVYLLMTRGQFSWSVYAMISGPLVLLAALFLLDWLYRCRPEAPSNGA